MKDRIQHLLDSFVQDDVAPGFAAAYATTSEFSPVYVAGVSDTKTKTPLKADAIWSLFSASKLVTSLATLKALEQGLVPGMDFETGLDDVDALTRWLPELAVGSSNTFMSIFDGWEDKEARKMRLRPAKKPVTLRHLLTFTAGSRGDFDDPDVYAFATPSDSAPAPFAISASNTYASLAQPRMCEAGDKEAFGYGGSAQDWIGILLVRALGKTQRQIFRELVLEPLGIEHKDYDYLTTDETRARKVPIWSRGEDGAWQQKASESMMESWVDGPDQEHHERAQAGFNGSAEAFVKLLHACITRSRKLLSTRGWDLAFRDGLADQQIQTKLPQPLLTGIACPHLVTPLFHEHEDTSVSLLQALYERHDSSTGSAAGSITWGGLANFWWWLDPKQGIAGVIATQTFPFYEKRTMEAVNKFKKLINDEHKAGNL